MKMNLLRGLLLSLSLIGASFVSARLAWAIDSRDGVEVLDGLVLKHGESAGGPWFEDEIGRRYCLVGADEEVRRQLHDLAFVGYRRQVELTYARLASSTTQTTAVAEKSDIDQAGYRYHARVHGEIARFSGCIDPQTGADAPVFLAMLVSVFDEQSNTGAGVKTEAGARTPGQSQLRRGHAAAQPPLQPCRARMPDQLQVLVTKEYGLSPQYVPDDLTPLADHAPKEFAVSRSILVRRVIVEPLIEMVASMRADGLRPLIHSAYRSYPTQIVTYRQWTRLYPDRGPFISAPAGHSEHQLGTALDFGSPELAKLVGGGQTRFHPAFAETSEGRWLQAHAHEYGFTLSYPDGATEVTGYYYEPWHYRYVGAELAELLHQEGMSLTEHLLDSEPAPCAPAR